MNERRQSRERLAGRPASREDESRRERHRSKQVSRQEIRIHEACKNSPERVSSLNALDIFADPCCSDVGRCGGYGDSDCHCRFASACQHSDRGPNGKRLVTASRDKTVRVSNLEDGQLEATYMNHGAPVLAAAFSQDGKLVLSGGRDRAVHGWRVSDGKEQFRLKEPEGDIQRLLVRSNDLFVASSDKLVRQYRIDTKALVRTFQGHRDWVQSLVVP